MENFPSFPWSAQHSSGLKVEKALCLINRVSLGAGRPQEDREVLFGRSKFNFGAPRVVRFFSFATTVGGHIAQYIRRSGSVCLRNLVGWGFSPSFMCVPKMGAGIAAYASWDIEVENPAAGNGAG